MPPPAFPKARLPANWVLLRLEEIAKRINPVREGEEVRQNGDPLLSLEDVLDAIKDMQQDVITADRQRIMCQARDVKSERLESLFKICIPSPRELALNEWKLNGEPHEPPPDLIRNLIKLSRVEYDSASEMSARLGVDFLILECHLKLIESYPHLFRKTNRPGTPPSANPIPLRIFPELDISVEVKEPNSVARVLVTGRADWAFGYGPREDTSSFFVAVEAKRPDNLAEAKNQLLAYLAILRERRIQARKENFMVQGFYTDGVQYFFLMISNDGIVSCSRPYNVHRPGELKTIFNFVVAVLDVAIKCSPHSTPTKEGKLRTVEIESHREVVFGKWFKEPCVVLYEDEDEEGAYLLDMDTE